MPDLGWTYLGMGVFVFSIDKNSSSETLYLQIYVSKKWGFTKYERDVYEKLREEGRLAGDGCNVKYRPEHGPLESWKKVQLELAQVA